VAHPVTWFQISGKDGAALEAFYKDIFDWKMSPSPDGSMSMVAADKGGIPGGVGASRDGSTNVTVYANVDDIAAHLKKIQDGAAAGHGMDRGLLRSSGQLGRPLAARHTTGTGQASIEESRKEGCSEGSEKESGEGSPQGRAESREERGKAGSEEEGQKEEALRVFSFRLDDRKVARLPRREKQLALGFAEYSRGSRSRSPIVICSSKTAKSS
jgi:hypothetical protein